MLKGRIRAYLLERDRISYSDASVPDGSDEPQAEPGTRPRNAAEQSAITMPDGVTLWTDRAMTREHVEKIRESHYCAGWDCVGCVWLATLDAMVEEVHHGPTTRKKGECAWCEDVGWYWYSFLSDGPVMPCPHCNVDERIPRPDNQQVPDPLDFGGHARSLAVTP
jgi:hypothetical protein